MRGHFVQTRVSFPAMLTVEDEQRPKEVQFGGLDSTTPRVRKVSWFLQGPDTSRFPRGCMLSQGFTKRKQEKQKNTKNIFVEMATWAEKALYPGGKHGFRGMLEFSS